MLPAMKFHKPLGALTPEEREAMKAEAIEMGRKANEEAAAAKAAKQHHEERLRNGYVDIPAGDPVIDDILKGERLKVWDRDAKLVPLLPNRIQRKVLLSIYNDNKTGRPVRKLLLKPRQVGLSAIVDAYIYTASRLREGLSSLISAQEQSTVDDLWTQKCKTFYENEEPLPDTEYNSMRRLHFSDTGSFIDVRPASDKLGKGGTRQNVHLTEFPFYRNPGIVLREVHQCVKRAAGTAVFIESTGAGQDEVFSSMFRQAIEAQQRGERTEYDALFYGWNQAEEYDWPLTAKELQHVKATIDSEEKSLMKEHGLTWGNIACRRTKLKTEYLGDYVAYLHDYPLTWQDAFIAARTSIFDRDSMAFYRDRMVQEPERKAVPVLDGSGNPRINDSTDGLFWMWQPPASRFSYTAYMDSAGDYGSESKDYHSLSAMAVIENETGEIVATWEGRATPVEFARIGIAIGRHYRTEHGEATLVIETNNHGHLTFNEVMRQRYKRMYWNPDYTGNILEKRHGFDMNQNTRSAAVDCFQALVQQRRIGIRCPRLFREMETFMKTSSASARAKKGCQDGLVIAAAGATLVAWRQKPEWAVRGSGAVTEVAPTMMQRKRIASIRYGSDIAYLQGRVRDTSGVLDGLLERV